MRTLLIALIILLTLGQAAAAQQTTWWLIVVTGVAIEGRTVSMFVGPYPTKAMCTAQIPDARRNFGIDSEVPVLSIDCRSNIDVARIVLSP